MSYSKKRRVVELSLVCILGAIAGFGLRFVWDGSSASAKSTPASTSLHGKASPLLIVSPGDEARIDRLGQLRDQKVSPKPRRRIVRKARKIRRVVRKARKVRVRKVRRKAARRKAARRKARPSRAVRRLVRRVRRALRKFKARKAVKRRARRVAAADPTLPPAGPPSANDPTLPSAPPPAARNAAPTQNLSGLFSRYKLRLFIRSKRHAVVTCYEKQLAKYRKLRGRISFLVTINTKGRATNTQIMQDQLGSLKVRRCIIRKLRTWRFPHRKDRSISVEIPYNLQPRR